MAAISVVYIIKKDNMLLCKKDFTEISSDKRLYRNNS